MWARPTMEWLFDIASDETLRPLCRWDTSQVYRNVEGIFDRVYNEPWTAKSWWEAQVRSVAI